VNTEGNRVDEGTVINQGTTCKSLQEAPQPRQLNVWKKLIPGRKTDRNNYVHRKDNHQKTNKHKELNKNK